MALADARLVQPVGQKSEGVSNYFIGPKESWRTNVPRYTRVRYPGVYEGIDLVFHGAEQQLEYDFVVSPGADPDRIAFHFGGTEVRVDGDGNLVLQTAAGDLLQRKPVSYQVIDGTRRTVESEYQIADGRIGFRLGAYDRSVPLVIDPVLGYSTFLGGTGVETVVGLKVDAAGCAYIAGYTDSNDLPTSASAHIRAHKGNNDVFVAKFNATGTALEYATYVGGPGGDQAADLAIDSLGQAYVVGTAEASFPTTPGAFHPGWGAFAFKLSSTGSQLLFSTFFDYSYAFAHALALDSFSNLSHRRGNPVIDVPCDTECL